MLNKPLHFKNNVLSRPLLRISVAGIILLLLTGFAGNRPVLAKDAPAAQRLSKAVINKNGAPFLDIDLDDDGLPDAVEGVGDKDGDGVINSLDLDSDNDGIPDLVEAGGVDANNDGKVDGTTDVNANGLIDTYDPAAGGVALANGDMDGDGIPNALDLDSDGDGIPDVEEAGITHNTAAAVASGTYGPDGWSDDVAALPSLVLGNADGDARPNHLDIDSDNDGITDNVEGQHTNQFVLPTGTDTDQDGIDNAYDVNDNIFYLSQGIIPVNFQGAVDVLPDYIDPDTDDDGIADIIEGHDANKDGVADYTLTGLDTDGDGLDDAFDLDNAAPNSKNQGMNGTVPPFFSANPPADPSGTLGSRGPLQKVLASDLDRAWRTLSSGATLPVTLVKFAAEKQSANTILVTWQGQNEVGFKEYVLERSTDGANYTTVATMAGKGGAVAQYAYTDNTGMQTGVRLYYRLKQVDLNERFTYSRILSVSLEPLNGVSILITPNPSTGNVALKVSSDRKRTALISIIDNQGSVLAAQRSAITNGDNIITLTDANRLPGGIYTVVLNTGEEKVSVKLIIQR